MWLPGAIALGFIGWLIGKGKKMGEVAAPEITMGVQAWLPYVKAVLKGDDVPFAMAWIAAESNGNPCAWGVPGAKGPDGDPLEQGIGQVYNTNDAGDDFQRYGIKHGELRVYCVPGTNRCSRKLTVPEIQRQAEILAKQVAFHTGKALDAAKKNGLKWGRRDLYRLGKLDHALPGLVRSGVALATASLKRAPRDWSEFRKTVEGGLKMASGTERYRKDFPRLFDNAESVGGAVSSSLSEKAVS